MTAPVIYSIAVFSPHGLAAAQGSRSPAGGGGGGDAQPGVGRGAGGGCDLACFL